MSHRPHKCNNCGTPIDSGARCSSCQAAKDAEEAAKAAKAQKKTPQSS